MSQWLEATVLPWLLRSARTKWDENIMDLLIGGLVLFFGFHMIPVLPGVRTKIRSSLGAGAYKGLFSLAQYSGWF